MHPSPRTGLVAALLTGMLVLSGAADAADPPTAASAPKKAASAPARAASAARRAVAGRGAASAPGRMVLLTPAQAKECLSQRQLLRAATDDAQKDKDSIATDRAEIEKSGAALTDKLATLDKSDAAQVDAYNARTDERGKQVDAYQAKVAAFNVKADALNASKASYADACANQRYDEDELAATTKKPAK